MELRELKNEVSYVKEILPKISDYEAAMIAIELEKIQLTKLINEMTETPSPNIPALVKIVHVLEDIKTGLQDIKESIDNNN